MLVLQARSLNISHADISGQVEKTGKFGQIPRKSSLYPQTMQMCCLVFLLEKGEGAALPQPDEIRQLAVSRVTMPISHPCGCELGINSFGYTGSGVQASGPFESHPPIAKGHSDCVLAT